MKNSIRLSAVLLLGIISLLTSCTTDEPTPKPPVVVEPPVTVLPPNSVPVINKVIIGYKNVLIDTAPDGTKTFQRFYYFNISNISLSSGDTITDVTLNGVSYPLSSVGEKTDIVYIDFVGVGQLGFYVFKIKSSLNGWSDSYSVPFSF